MCEGLWLLRQCRHPPYDVAPIHVYKSTSELPSFDHPDLTEQWGSRLDMLPANASPMIGKWVRGHILH
jgi:hypothetical protein